MSRYVVLDADWLEQEIRTAEILREHAQETGKAVAIAAAAIRVESMKEVRRRCLPALPLGEGNIAFSIEGPPPARAGEDGGAPAG